MTDAPTLKDVIAEALKAAVHAIYTARGLDPEKEVWVGPNAEDYRQRDDVAIEKHTPLIEAYHAALTAAGYVVEQDWRDIATAPMDGTEVLVRAAMPDRLQWADPDKQLRPVVRVAAWHPDAGWCVDELREATLWRPLPAGPTTEGEGS